MASKDKYPYYEGGVQETSLDEVEVDIEGNITFPDSTIDETETDAVGVDEDGNLRITSASKLLNSSKDQIEMSSYDLSPEERQSLQKRQDDKRHYSAGGSSEEEKEMSGRRGSYTLAIDSSERGQAGESRSEREPALDGHDMHDIEMTVIDHPRTGHSAEEVPYHRPVASAHSLERGDREEHHTSGKETRAQRFLHIVDSALSGSSPKKLVLITAVVVLVIGGVLTLGLVPASFVYVEYYELALAKNRVSGRVNREDVYYPGCYLLTPDVELIRFQGTAHNVKQDLHIFTSDRLSFSLQISLQYFIKPRELGELFTNYAHDYRPVVESMIESTVKNTAVDFNLDTVRLNRSHVERVLRQAVASRLSGNCCPSCCPRGCSASIDCHSCRLSGRGCSKGIHMELRYFQMGEASVPEEVSERFLRQTILQIEAEKELFVQEHALVEKDSERLQKEILNSASEIRKGATAEAMKIRSIAKADYEKKVQTSYAEAFKKMYQRLNITQEDHKLSLMYIRALEGISDHLYNLNFEQLTSYG